MRPALILAAVLALAGCAEPVVTRDVLIVPRPVPLDPEPAPGALGPVLAPAVTVPYYSVLGAEPGTG